MSKKEGFHDYLLRIPEDSWQAFLQVVEQLRPKRSVNQQIVHLLEEFTRAQQGNRVSQPGGTSPSQGGNPAIVRSP